MAVRINRSRPRRTRRGPQLFLSRRPQLFLSHSSLDRAFVRRLARDLAEVGVDAWFDEWELQPGDSLTGAIGQALERSRYVGLVLSPAFLKSRWGEREIDQALAREERRPNQLVIPLMYKRAVPPPFVEGRVYIDFSKSYYPALTRLAGFIHDLGQQIVSEELERAALPRSTDAVRRVLVQAGWEEYEAIDSHVFDEIAKVGGVVKGNQIEFYPETILRLKDQLSPAVVRILKRMIAQDRKR